jgi:hypothetical protein
VRYPRETARPSSWVQRSASVVTKRSDVSPGVTTRTRVRAASMPIQTATERVPQMDHGDTPAVARSGYRGLLAGEASASVGA